MIKTYFATRLDNDFINAGREENKTVRSLFTTNGIWIIVASVISAVMIFYHLGLIALINPDEGRNASIAWEMYQHGNWFVPTYDGLAYLDKPFLFFKFVAFSFSVFGHSAFAARLPSAVFAVGVLLLVMGFCKREFDLRTGALAVTVISTTLLFFGLARYVIFDMTLAFFVCAAILAGYFSESSVGNIRRYWSAAAAIAMGFGVLVKGPVGFIVPLLVLGVFNHVDGTRGAVRRLLCRRNILIMLAIILPWFVAVSWQRPDFPYYGIVRESILRFTTNDFHRWQPFYFYIPVTLVAMLFWSLVLPQTLWKTWRQRDQLGRAERLMIVWAIVVLAFFSVSQSKQPAYILTAVVALSVLVAKRFAHALNDRADTLPRIGAAVLACITGIVCASLIVCHLHPDVFGPQTAPTGLTELRSVIAAAGVPLIAGFLVIAALSAYAAIANDARASLAAFVACPMMMVLMILPPLRSNEQHRTDRELVQNIHHLAPNASVACYLCFPPGMPFYLRRNTTIFTNGNGHEIASNYIKYSMAPPAVWPDQLQPAANLSEWAARQHKPVFLIAKENHINVLESLAALRHAHVQALAGGYYAGFLLKPTVVR